MAAIMKILCLVVFLGLLNIGNVQGKPSDLTIVQKPTGNEANNTKQWRVEVVNVSPCIQYDVKLLSTGFKTVERVDPEIVSVTDNLISINNPIYPQSSIHFTYAWDHSFSFKVEQGNAQCKVSNLTVGQKPTGNEVNFTKQWQVEVVNVSPCTQLDVKLLSIGFKTVERVDPEIVSVTGNLISINNPINPRSTIHFTYGWDHPFSFKVAQGNAQCKPSDLTISQKPTGNEVNGTMQWQVEVVNVSPLPQLDVKLLSTGFKTVERVDPEIVSVIGNLISINNPIYPHSPIHFTYAWDHPFSFKVVQS